MNILRTTTVLLIVAVGCPALAQVPNSVLNRVFPMGGQAGKTVEVTLEGSALTSLTTLHTNAPGLQFKRTGKSKFQIHIPANTPGGIYDLRAVGKNGVSSPRAFQVSRRLEVVEQTKKSESWKTAQQVPLNSVINGRIESGGDQDFYRFTARKGQRVVVACWSDRIDSNLRAIIEVLDSGGRQIAVNRGFYGVDPLIDLQVLKDDSYIVKIYDLVYSGGANHYYRLEVDAGPRVAFAMPNVIARGKPAKVKLFGWNLRQPTQPVSTGKAGQPSAQSGRLEEVTVDIPAAMAQPSRLLPVRRTPAAAVFSGFAYTYRDSHTPVLIGVSNDTVDINRSDNHSPQTAQRLAIPSDLSGRLVRGNERDWYAVDVKRGEVIYVEALGQRIGSPVDLDLSILDSQGKKILAQFNDEVRNFGGTKLPTNHHDPMGRWVAPSDGRFLIVVRNLTGGSKSDARRTYRLQVTREVPDVSVTVTPFDSSAAGIHVSRGGRTRLDVLAVRRRGLKGSIKVSATHLPPGVECTPIWLGPGVSKASLILSATDQARIGVGQLRFQASSPLVGARSVNSGVMVRSGRPAGWSRLVDEPPVAVVGESAVRITANGHETRKHHLYGELKVRHSPGGVLDVAVNVERKYSGHNSPVQLIGIGLPGQIQNQTATIPSGKGRGYISFYLPPTLPVGRYSLCIQATTKVVLANKKSQSVTLYSNPVVFDVHPPAFVVEIDPYAPRQIKRGQVLQVKYTCKRINGFINKIHSELAAPGFVTKVRGLRGRGVTFVGQTQSGNIQIIANKDAQLGQQAFLRIYGVGVIEDEAVFHGSCFLKLKIVP